MSTEIGQVAGIQVGTFVGPIGEDRLRISLYSSGTMLNLTRKEARALASLLQKAASEWQEPE